MKNFQFEFKIVLVILLINFSFACNTESNKTEPKAEVQEVTETEETPEVTVADNPMKVDPREYLREIKLPEGFNIEIYAENVIGARSMALGPNGTLFVGTFQNFANEEIIGKVYAIPDRDGDFKGDELIVVAEGLNCPNGVAIIDGDLYIAEISRITRLDNIEEHLDAPPELVVVKDDYPSEMWHGWKFIRFGPDGKLYVPVGAPCNTCEPEDSFSAITRINPDGSGYEVFAKGIRNSVGFDWHPETKELWFTENGRDMWGNDMPPEELNHAPQQGLHFGFPYRYGKSHIDTTYKTGLKDEDFQEAAYELPAHTAPLGMRFYTGNSFPKEYENRIFLAHHGSWNRAQPDGYRLSLVTLEDNKAVSYEDFATGWLMDDQYWGRPVDVQVLSDGSMLVSDDFADCIYRIYYGD